MVYNPKDLKYSVRHNPSYVEQSSASTGEQYSARYLH